VIAGSHTHLLVLGEYCSPGAGLLTETCDELATTSDVTVLTGRLRGHEAEADYDLRNGVDVIRLHSTSFDRAELIYRADNYLAYVVRAVRRGLAGRRPDLDHAALRSTPSSGRSRRCDRRDDEAATG